MDDSSRLCTHCSICCDGRLHDYARIAEGEEAAIRAAGLEIVHDEADIAHFLLPCHYLADGCCTRYETRFHVCRSYKCELLRAVRRGSVDLPSAMATVDRAKQLLAVAERHLDGPATRPRRRAKLKELRNLPPTADRAAREAGARAQLDLTIVTLFFERHFLRPRPAEPNADLPDTRRPA